MGGKPDQTITNLKKKKDHGWGEKMKRPSRRDSVGTSKMVPTEEIKSEEGGIKLLQSQKQW